MKNFKKVLSLALALLMVVGCMVVAPVETKAATLDDVVIYEVYGGGGNSGAVYTHDYIVLYNPTSEEISLEGCSVQYRKANDGTTFTGVASLNGKIEPNKYYLIQGGKGNNGSAFPDSIEVNLDASGNINMGGKAGIIALAKTTDALTGTTDTNIIDLVGFGSCDGYEGSGAAPAPSATTSVIRNASGTDTDNNNADFTTTTPNLAAYVGKLSAVVVKENITLDADATPAEIVDAAYKAEEDGVYVNGSWTLEGVITSIDTPYDARYSNITVTMVVGDRTDKPIQCYRLTVEDKENAEELAKLEGLSVGDTIKVYGEFGYYNGKVQYNAGSVLKSVEAGELEPTLGADATPQQIVDKAYELAESGEPMIGDYTLSGVITAIDTAYSEQYGNITVTIDVDDADKSMMCYRLSGTGCENLKVGYEITVNGSFGSHNGKPQFAQGCTLVSYKEGTVEPTLGADATPQQIVDAAYAAMESGEPMIGEYKLTGVITSIDTEYSEQYGNITVTMSVNGADKSIQCYRLSGTGVENLKVGDTITVNGTLGSYNGTVQYNQGSTLVSYTPTIKDAGDNAGLYVAILLIGCAAVVVAFVGKKKFA